VQLFSVLVQQLSPLQPWYNFREELQCAALGALFVFVGVANFVTTVQVRACARRRPARAPPRAATPPRAALTAPPPAQTLLEKGARGRRNARRAAAPRSNTSSPSHGARADEDDGRGGAHAVPPVSLDARKTD
jgi:Zn-dependent protease with chaperone function